MVDLTERIFSSVPDDPSDLSLWGDESDEPEVDETESSHHKDGRPLKEEQEHKEPPQQSTESEEKGGEEGLPVSQGSEKEKKKSIRYLSAEEAWNRRGVIRYQSEEAERKDDGTEEKTSSLLGRGKERSEAPVAWALAGAAIHKPGGVVLPSHPDAYDAPPIREALFQHPLLKGLVVVISGKEELTPWLTTQDLFTTLVDTCISSILQTRLSDGETGRREPLLLSASWNYSNSARENCAWNALTIAAASIKTWREAVDEVLKQIGSLCIYGIEQPELNWILTSLRKCYRDSMSQQECQSGESILEEIVETCLTGCIMTSRKQEYEAYEQLAGKVTSQVIQARAQQVFYHIRHYADQAYKGTKSHPRASLFVYAPTHEPADEDLGLRFLRSSSSSMSFSCANSPSSSLLTTARATSSICSELIPQGSPSSSSPRSSSAHHERRPSRSFSRGNSLPFIPASDEAQEEAADREKDEEEEEKNTLMPSQSHPPLDPASSSSSVLSSSSPTSHLDKTGDSSHPPRMLSSQRKTDEREGSEGGLSSNSKSNHRAGAKEEEKTVEEREGDEKIGGAGEGGTGAEFVLCIDEVSICIKEALENRSIEPEGFHIPDTLLDPEKFEAHVSAHPAILVPPLLRNAVKLHGVSQVDVVQQFASTDGYHDADLDLHCWRFSNGAAINAKQTTFEKNRCQVRLFFMGGESAGVNENERQLLDLGMKTLMDGGIAKHQQKSVDKLCALWGIYISSQVEPEV
ncbi:peptidase m16 inactive domain-containing protein, partial [Cystoisospora suis]